MIMKKYIILLLINLYLPTLSFSQNTYPQIIKDSLIVITPMQLKKTNLIFVEHSEMKKEIPLLKDIIYFQDSTINLMKESKLIYDNQINNYRLELGHQNEQINNLNNKINIEIKKKNNYKQFAIGGFITSLGLLLITIL